MKYPTTLLAIVFGVCAVAPLTAQTGTIGVKKGAKISFEAHTTTNIVQGQADQMIKIDMVTQSKPELKAVSVASDAIDWVYTIADAKMRVNSPMVPKGGVDSVLKVKPYSFSTDARGVLTKSSEADGALNAVMGSAVSGAFSSDQFFSPTLRRTLNPGDGWDLSSTDTVNLGSIDGFKIVVHRTVHYTYEGIVDTLETKAHRVRANSTALTLEGSGNTQGLDLTMSGDGLMQSVSYYSAAENVLLVSVTESQTNMRLLVTGQAEMVLPVNQKTKVVTARR